MHVCTCAPARTCVCVCVCVCSWVAVIHLSMFD